MSNQLRRWSIGIALVACCTMAMPANAATAPASGSSPATIQAWVDSEIAALTSAPDAKTAADTISEMLEPLKRRELPALYKQIFAKQANNGLDPILKKNTTPTYVAVAGVRLLSELNQINASPALQDNMGHPNAAVRYWVMKGLIRLIPALTSIHDTSVPTIVATLAKTGAGLDAETDPVVVAEMARLLAVIGDPDAFVPLAKKLTSMAADGNAPQRANLDAATALLNAIIDISAKNPVPAATANDIIHAENELLKKQEARLHAHHDKTPLDTDLISGLKNEYKAFRTLIEKIGTKPVTMLPESDIPADLFKAIEDANTKVAAAYK